MFTMKVEGGSALAAALRELSPRRERTALSAMLLLAAEPIRARAQELAPIEAGKPDLKDNILAKAVNDKALGQTDAFGPRDREETESVVAIGPGKDSYYGLFQEFGTVRHGAQPFMRPAFDEKSAQAMTILQREIWAWLRKHSQATNAPSPTGRTL